MLLAAALLSSLAYAQIPSLMARFDGHYASVSVRMYSITGGTYVRVGAGYMPYHGDYEYHIHEHPVTNGCESTGGHFDPYGVTAKGVTPVPGRYDTFETGDLSGKYGKLSAGKVITALDNTIRLFPSTVGDILAVAGRSIVIHHNGARVACANLVHETFHPTTQSSLDAILENTKKCCEGWEWHTGTQNCIQSSNAYQHPTNTCSTGFTCKTSGFNSSLTYCMLDQKPQLSYAMECCAGYEWSHHHQRCVPCAPGSPSHHTQCSAGLKCKAQSKQCETVTQCCTGYVVCPETGKCIPDRFYADLRGLCPIGNQCDGYTRECFPTTKYEDATMEAKSADDTSDASPVVGAAVALAGVALAAAIAL